MFRACSGFPSEQPVGNRTATSTVQEIMIFLDTDTDFFVATTRREMVVMLLERLDNEPEHSTLAALAAACLGCEPLDVVVLET